MSVSFPNLLDENSSTKLTDFLTLAIKSWGENWFMGEVSRVEIALNQNLFGSLTPLPNLTKVTKNKDLVLSVSTDNYEQTLFSIACDYKHELVKQDQVLVKKFNNAIIHDLLNRLNVSPEQTVKDENQIYIRAQFTLTDLTIVCELTWGFVCQFLQLASKNKPLNHISLTSLIKSEVDIRLPISTCNLDLTSLANLKVGDVIKLAQKISDPIKIEVNGIDTSVGSYLVSHKQQKAIIFSE